MKIVVLDGWTLNPGDLSWDELKKLGDVTIYDRTPADKIIERIGDAEIIFTNKTVLTKDVIEKAGYVRYIGVLATGYNIVDTEVAKSKGIIVCNVPTYGTASVAQFTFALILEMCHHVWIHSEEVKKGAWIDSPDFCFWKYPLIELADKFLGIIGFGRIGQAVGKIALSLGMKVLAFDSNKNRELENDSLKYVELDELLKKSDIITLHCPLFESTKGMINKNSIAKMKDGAMVINTARGSLIIEEDLAEALNKGKLSGAAVDVVSYEPIKKDNPLLKAKNCIITPHIAWAPKESRIRLMNTAADNLKQFLAGNPINVVNK